MKKMLAIEATARWEVGWRNIIRKKYLKRNRVKNQYEKPIKRRISCNELENSKAEDNKWTKILLQNFFRLNLY